MCVGVGPRYTIPSMLLAITLWSIKVGANFIIVIVTYFFCLSPRLAFICSMYCVIFIALMTIVHAYQINRI